MTVSLVPESASLFHKSAGAFTKPVTASLRHKELLLETPANAGGGCIEGQERCAPPPPALDTLRRLS
jgi:hypothetical protein